MTNRETRNAHRLLTGDKMAGEAQRVASTSSPEEFKNWGLAKLATMALFDGVDVATLCAPEVIAWAELHRRLV